MPQPNDPQRPFDATRYDPERPGLLVRDFLQSCLVRMLEMEVIDLPCYVRMMGSLAPLDDQELMAFVTACSATFETLEQTMGIFSEAHMGYESSAVVIIRLSDDEINGLNHND